ncbi:hypothetical protein ABZP36_014213 [Zizania latifolia]
MSLLKVSVTYLRHIHWTSSDKTNERVPVDRGYRASQLIKPADMDTIERSRRAKFLFEDERGAKQKNESSKKSHGTVVAALIAVGVGAAGVISAILGGRRRRN